MDKKEILEMVKKEGIGFIRLQICDINGMVKNAEIPVDQLEKALDGRVMFDGSSIEGFVRIDESDMFLVPDMDTFAILPWSDEKKPTARLICDVYRPNGKPYEADPRYVLKKVLSKAKEMGYEVYAGPEPEFFLFRRDEKGRPTLDLHDKGSYFDLMPVDLGEETRKEIVLALEKMGFDVEMAHHEVAPAQHEIDFAYSNALKTADNIQTFKIVVKTIALFKGLHATFMPKPVEGINGSGMHTHQSLSKDGKNAFYDPQSQYQLSSVALNYIGGLLTHAREITLVTNPIVNSYKRLIPGYEAPVNIGWSIGNRTALVRVPAIRGEATRLEYRCPDPTANPYFALAAMVGAGLDGIEKDTEPPNPVEENIFQMNEEEKESKGIGQLPGTLQEATYEFEHSSLMKEVLGESVFEKLIKTKKGEWHRFSSSVTDWERQEYLELY
ncbi:MAG: type I glutamate--ammonia ligase [Thermotogae bacterium]|nr:type I glutamate--ammonia ligase [Thermotogota bacterium]